VHTREIERHTKVSTKVSTAHTTKPASRNFLQQQARVDRFLE